MNHIYRTVWNDITRAYSAAAETVRGKGKSSSSKRSADASAAALASGGVMIGGCGTAAAPGRRRLAGLGARPLALEQRFMFDGAAVGALFDAASAAHPSPDAAVEHAAAERIPAALEAAPAAPRKEVAFIDKGVSDYRVLADAIAPGIEVVLLDAGQSGLDQMAQWAAGHAGYDAIHVLSHGSKGQLRIGASTLTQATLERDAAALARIGAALTERGDILLYGCDIARGADGMAFIAKLAQATGADVAASSDTTGAATRGGDWTLEQSSGAVETAARSVPQYAQALTSVTFTGDAGQTHTGIPLDTGNPSNASTSVSITGSGETLVIASTGGDGSGLFVGTSSELDSRVFNPALTGSIVMTNNFWESSTSLTFTVQGGKFFDFTSIKLEEIKSVASAVIFTPDGHAGDAVSINYSSFEYKQAGPADFSSAAFKNIQTLTITATNIAGGQFDFYMDDIVLDNIHGATPTTTIASAAFSADTGSSSADFITKTAAQTVSGTLSANLASGETVYVSLNNGSTWSAASASVGSSAWSLAGRTLAANDTLKVKVSNADGDGAVYSLAYVLDTTAPTSAVATAAFSADTGSSSTDFITKTAAQTVSGTLSANLASGETVSVSLDNGATWTAATASVGSSAWSLAGCTLSASDTLKVKVSDTAGNDGAVYSQAYVLDTSAPTTTIATRALSADTAANGASNTDFITKTAAQTISGTLSANLAAGETVSVSLDNGSTWTAASASVGSTAWSLAGQTLSPSSTLKVKVGDSAGNDGTVASQAYTLDQSAPTTTVTTASFVADTSSQTISGTLSANLVSGETVYVSLDNGATWAAAAASVGASTWSLAGQSFVASNTLKVKVTDTAGNDGAVRSDPYVIVPTVSLSVDNAGIAEAAGVATVTATLSMTAATDTVVTLSASGTAGGGGADYTLSSSTITIAAGQLSGTATVTAAQDALDEAGETVVVSIAGVSGGDDATESGSQQATITITDDDATPTLSIGAVSINEGDSGSSNATFTVTLDAASGQAVAVNYATGNGSATAGSDYTAVAGTLNFAAGETSKTFTVAIAGDALNEADEAFTAALSAPTNANLGTSAVNGTISNDDATPSLSIGDVSIAEGDSGSSNATFTVTLSAASGLAVAVDYATGDGTASDGSDYTGVSGTLNFAAGETTKTFTVAIAGDTALENDETFGATLSGALNATLGSAAATATISNDEPVPTLSVDSVSLTEGGSGSSNLTFTVTLSAASGLPISVDYATGDDTASAGSDYTGVSGTLHFAAGETSKTFTVAVAGDTLWEGNESFDVTLSNPGNASLGTAAGSGTIDNDDPSLAPTLTGLNAVSFAEDTVNAAAQLIDASVVFADSDSADLNGGALTITYAAGGGAEDQLSLNAAGGITLAGATVSYNGSAIGTVDATLDGVDGAGVTVHFTSSAATPAAVKALIQALAYRNTSDTPAATRTISIQVDDGAGGVGTAATAVITVTAENDAPSILKLGGDQTGFALGAADSDANFIDAQDGFSSTVAEIADPDGGFSPGGSLTISRTSGPSSGTFYFDASGASEAKAGSAIDGSIGAGDTVYVYNGSSWDAVGTIASGPSGDGFNLAFGAGATPFNIGKVLQYLKYTADAGVGQRVFSVVVNDGGADSAPVAFSVDVTGPALASATYDVDTGVLSVTGSGMTVGDTIDLSKITVRGQGGATRTLTTANVTATSATTFSATLNGADQSALNVLFNKNGLLAIDASAFNLAAADDWDGSVTAGDTSDASNAVTVSNQIDTSPVVDLNAGVGAGASAAFAEATDQGAANGGGVALAPGALLSDPDGTIDTIVVELTNGQGDSGERLFLSGTLTGVTYTLDSAAKITLTRTGSTADMQAALQAVRYQNNSDAPHTTSRDITVKAADNTGLFTSETVTLSLAAANDAPSGAVTLAGSVYVGVTLQASQNLADGDGIGAVSFQWQESADGSSWSDLSGATGASLALTDALLGKHVRAVASYTDAGGTAEQVASAASAVVATAPVAPPVEPPVVPPVVPPVEPPVVPPVEPPVVPPVTPPVEPPVTPPVAPPVTPPVDQIPPPVPPAPPVLTPPSTGAPTPPRAADPSPLPNPAFPNWTKPPAPLASSPLDSAPGAGLALALGQGQGQGLGRGADNGFAPSYTQAGTQGGFAVVIAERQQGGADGLTIARGMGDQQITASGAVVVIPIPADAFAHSDANAVVTLQAKMANGAALPSWVQFDASSGKFVVAAPPGVARDLVVKVTARDTNGKEAVLTFKIKLASNRPQAMLERPGRLGLSAQIRLAGERPAPLDHLFQAARAAAPAARTKA